MEGETRFYYLSTIFPPGPSGSEYLWMNHAKSKIKNYDHLLHISFGTPSHLLRYSLGTPSFTIQKILNLQSV
jgi:hypothetical protein